MSSPRVINLTLYPVFLNPAGAPPAVIPPAPRGEEVVMDVEDVYVPGLMGVPVQHRTYGAIHRLPDPAPDTFYLVPPGVLRHPALRERTDVFSCGETDYREAVDAIEAEGSDDCIRYDVLYAPVR